MNNLEYHSVKTILLKSHENADVDHAAALLLQEKMVALPTETVYGLAANGLSKTAIQKIFKAKDRPLLNPLILHAHNTEQAASLLDFSRVDPQVLERFHKLAHTFWPGPLTIIAPKADHIPSLATAGLNTAAVRVPNNECTRAILQKLPFPLVMPSANLSTRPSPTCAEHVLATLDGRIDAIVDDGPCTIGIESTVVKLMNSTCAYCAQA